MADKNVTEQVEAQRQAAAKKMKTVRNRSGHRVELVIDGKVVVFYPGRATKVPADADIPGGLGLYVR